MRNSATQSINALPVQVSSSWYYKEKGCNACSNLVHQNHSASVAWFALLLAPLFLWPFLWLQAALTVPVPVRTNTFQQHILAPLP